MKQPFLFVALDDLGKKEKETLEIAEQLSGVEGPFGFKVNLDYLLNPTMSLKTALSQVQRFGRPVFADLKMWNGTRTMASVIRNLADNEVDYLNVYALADDLLPGAVKIAEGSKTKILGLTVLTHFSEAYCQKHFRRSLRETVRHFAEVALERGCHGIILPGTALDIVQDLETEKVVPGVRPKWYKDTRHKEEIEPKIAVDQGADKIVCGSPIMKDADKVAALKRILSEMTGQPMLV
jgi:orotidine 5'-phosphate decarboxylase subfamily 1